jgi:beta-phosphoglucomutase-like phosphatase (HAD superfamily)
MSNKLLDWQVGEVAADKFQMFTLWAVHIGFCNNAADFLRHFDKPELFERSVNDLLVAGFLDLHGRRLQVTNRGLTALGAMVAADSQEAEAAVNRVSIAESNAVMETEQRLSAILELQLALNYLKLCADHDNPVGGGVPVDIVAMPDFIVDVDGYAVAELNKRHTSNRFASAEVGSRAGRVLSVLAHLRDLDDEGFRLHYITKTGAVGRQVLEQRLNTDLRAKHLEPLTFPLLLPVKETRFAVLGRNKSDERPSRQVAVNADPLTIDDLRFHFYDPIKTIANAAAVYFGTDSSEQFTKLLSLAVLGNIEGAELPLNERHVFVDLSTIHNENGQPGTGLSTLTDEGRDAYSRAITALIDARNKGKSRTRLTIIVMSNERQSRDLWQELLLQRGWDTLLAYDEETMRLIDNGEIRHASAVRYNQRPGGRDAFVAGFLLHRAMAAAWKRVPAIERMRFFATSKPNQTEEGKLQETEAHQANNEEPTDWEDEWCAGLFPNPYSKSVSEPWPISKAVEIGAALATLWFWCEDRDQIPDKRQLLFANLSNEEQEKWDEVATEHRSHLRDSMKILKQAAEDGMPGPNPLAFCCTATLLVRSWINGQMDDDLQTDLKNGLFRLAVESDLTMSPPTMWRKAGNTRTRPLRLNSARTVQCQFVLDLLRRMSLEPEQWKEAPTDELQSGRACLFDLDGTLILSSNLRNTCLKRAFLEMLREDKLFEPEDTADAFPAIPRNYRKGIDIQKEWEAPDVPTLLERCVKLFGLAVYKRSGGWMDLLESYAFQNSSHAVIDFRQVWNHPLSYVAFVKMLEVCLSNLGHNELLFSQKTPANVLVRASCDDCYHDLMKLLADPKTSPTQKLIGGGDIQVFHREVVIWETQCRRAFRAAETAYWMVDFEAIPHIKQLLRTLRDVLSARVYVATEGHHDTQLEKLRTVGLDTFFPEACTLSTGAAATPTDHERLIVEEITERVEKIKDWRKSRKRLWREVVSFPNLPALAPCPRSNDGTCIATLIYNTNVNSLATVRENLKMAAMERKNLKFYTNLWAEYEEKQDRAIFSLIFSCIMADPKNPGTCLTHFEILDLALDDQQRQARSLSFVMIGDREKKDIRPVLECWFGKLPVPDDSNSDPVTTVRLLTKDHAGESGPWQSSRELAEKNPPENPLAKYISWNPMQTLLILVHRGAWPKAQDYDALPPIMNIRLFDRNENIDFNVWSSMAWGETWEKYPHQETCRLMNRIITRCNIQGSPGAISFARALVTILRQRSRTNGTQIKHAQLAWTTIEQLLSIMASLGTPSAKLGAVAGIVSEAVRDEIDRGINWQNGHHDLVVSAMERCMIHCPVENVASIALAVAEALKQSRSNDPKYHQAWNTALAAASSLAKRVERADKAAHIISKAACSEIIGRHVGKTCKHDEIVVDLFKTLAGTVGKTLCDPPDGPTWRGVENQLSLGAKHELGIHFHEEWIKHSIASMQRT